MNIDVVDFDVLKGLLDWAIVVAIVSVVGLLMGLLFSFLYSGARGPRNVFGWIRRFFIDMVKLSPQRVWALSQLTFREAFRRKVWFIFVIFALLFMFAGWFMSKTDMRPELQVRVHVAFVLQAISWLMIPVVMLLSCWGLPEDIKARSLHTVVTKPTRKNEIYLGRVCGLTMIATMMLVIMGAVGYVWTVRQVPEEAKSELVCRVPIYGDLTFTKPDGTPGEGVNTGDEYMFRSYIAGATQAKAIWIFDNVTRERCMTIDPSGDETKDYLLLESRMESFRTHKGRGKQQRQGLNCEFSLLNNLREQTANLLSVSIQFPGLRENLLKGDYKTAADEMVRSASGLKSGQAKLGRTEYKNATKGFQGFARLLVPLGELHPDETWIQEVTTNAKKCENAASESSPNELADGLQDMAATFRTHGQAIAQLLVDKVAKIPSFQLQEFRDPHQERIKPSVTFTVNGNEDKLLTGDLFEHFVHGGELHVAVRCLDPGQYIGMGRPDLFIRTVDYNFWVGFSKAIFGIWLMLVLVIILGVTASCFLKGPIATLLILFLVILGSPFYEFLDQMVNDDKQHGKGAISAGIRIATHMNPQSELEDIKGERAIKAADFVFYGLTQVVYKVVPNFNNFRTVGFLASGFDIPWRAKLLPAVLTVIGFFFPCLVLGYFSLTLRELEEK